MMEKHQNIEFSDEIAIFDIQAGAGRAPEYQFSDNLAIFDIWPRNFDYTGHFNHIQSYGASTPISNFTGCGHFVTYIRYSGTK
jgi:hypothetical protein